MDFNQFMIELAGKFPIILAILAGMGLARVLIKGLWAVAKAVVDYTPSKKDDEVFMKIDASPIKKAIFWLLDFVASIKLPGAPGTVQAIGTLAPAPEAKKE